MSIKPDLDILQAMTFLNNPPIQDKIRKTLFDRHCSLICHIGGVSWKNNG